MLLAAAACAAAGISYIFNDENENKQSINKSSEKVTASSTIIDKQGIVKYVIYPQMINPYHRFINQEYLFINKSKIKQWELPIINDKKEIVNEKINKDVSIVFYWSIPLKARLLQVPTKSCVVIENLNPFQRNVIKISIGIQNENRHISSIPSEIALSNSDHTLDSLSTVSNDIMKKKKIDYTEQEYTQKRFCFDRSLNQKNIILNNVNLCVENLSKILSQSCSNTQPQITTLQNSYSLCPRNHNQQITSITEDILQHEKLFNRSESISSNPNEKLNSVLIEQLSDGIILHRGKQFGSALGEPMIRKTSENENCLIDSSHSIDQLNRLLSKTNCLLMRQYHIESIEDLIRLFLEHGQEHFTQLMINLFKVHPSIVEQFSSILINWAKQFP